MLFGWRRIYEAALRDLEAPCRLLDVACGTGALTEMARSRGLDAVGLDYCQKMLLKAQDRFGGPERNGHFTKGSAYILPYPENTFDAVISTAALTGMDHAHQALREMVRVCKPGGLVRVVDYWRSENPGVSDRIFIKSVESVRHTFYPMAELFRAVGLEMNSQPVAFMGKIGAAEAIKK